MRALFLLLAFCQLPSQPNTTQTVVKKPGSLIEIVSKAPADSKTKFIVVEPADCDFREYQTPESRRAFVTTALSNTGFVKVIEFSYNRTGEEEPTYVFHVFDVGLPLPPGPKPPVVLPTAKLTVDKNTISSPGEQVVATWSVTGPPGTKAVFDGVSVEMEGSKVLLPQQPINLYTLTATSIDHTIYAQQVVTIGEKPPPVDPAPIKLSGLRVLITFDDDKKNQLSRDQIGIIDSSVLRSYLDEKCAKAGDQTSEWRIVPHTTEFHDDQPTWKQAMAIPRDKSEWLIVSNGKSGYSGPLPANLTETLNLIKSFEGVK